MKTSTVNVWEVLGYRTEMSPFGGVKDCGLGYKEGDVEAVKSYTTVKTSSRPSGLYSAQISRPGGPSAID